MRGIAFTAAMFWLVSFACAQPVPTTNPSFEQGTDSPTGWKLIGKGEWLKGDAAEGNRAISAIGEGKSDSYWLSDPLSLKPATVYRLSFKAKMNGTGGTPVSGPLFCNRDLGQIGGDWRQFDSIFITPTTVRPEDCRLRFGQWEVKGTVAFDGIELFPVDVLYSDLDDIALGQGETILGNTYTFTAPFRDESCNYSRPLDSFNCGFNSDRWVFTSGSAVVYCQRITRRRQLSAEVSASVTWYASGRLLVEASADGETWRRLGTIDKVATKSFQIPATMLPADRIYIRMSGENGAAPASFQVGSYGYTAKLDGQPITLVGRSEFSRICTVKIGTVDDRFAFHIDNMDVRIVDSYHRHLRLRVDNKSGVATELQPFTRTTARIGSRTVTWSVPGCRQRVQPGTSYLTLAYDLPASGGENEVEILIGAGSETLTMQGQQLFFHAIQTVHQSDLDRNDFGQVLWNGPNKIWWAESGWKIGRRTDVPQERGTALRLNAARNESEAAQLVLRPVKPLRGFKAKVYALRGPDRVEIPAENTEVLRVRYLAIAQPTDRSGTAGMWPDPLVPLSAPVDLAANENQPLWIRVHVPKDTRPGDYTGVIAFSADDYADEVRINVHVYAFTLPDRMTCQSALGFSPENVWKYQKLDKIEDRRAVLDKYLADFSAHHISPYDPAPLDPIKVTWADAKTNPRAVFDFAAWDKAMTRAVDQYHFNSFVVHVPGMGGGTFHSRVDPELLGFKEDSPQYKAAFESYAKQLQEHLREKGWLKYAYLYWFDEPAKKDYEFVMNGFRKLKSAAPDISRMLTEKVEPDLVGGPNIWCPISPNYNHERAEARRKEGEKFWWYVCTGPKAPYCTLFIDHPATELRAWLWQTWQRKIDGILVWDTNYWTSGTAYPDRNRPQNPYDDPMSWTSGYGVPVGTKQPWGNGDGRFIYPPEAAANANSDKPILDGPVDSMRWEMLRDGIEDYEYLVILRRLIDEKRDKLSAEQWQEYSKLLEVPAEITKDMTTFTKDPRPIEQRRDEIARAIEKVMKM